MVRASVSTSWAAPARSRRALVDPLVETASLDVFERKERPPFKFAGLEYLHDIGVKQFGNCFRLGSKPRQANLPGVRPRQDHLERDQSPEPAMAGLVDHPHASPAELCEDVVARNRHALERDRVR